MVTPVPRAARGFTLIELLISLTILAILAGVAAPSVSEMMGRQRLRTATSDVINSLIRTRSTAIKMQVNVTMRPVVAGTAWAGGWYIQHPTMATVKLFNQDEIQGATITGPTLVTYRFSGRVTPTTTAPSWQVSTSGTAEVRCITLGLNGLPAQKSAAC